MRIVIADDSTTARMFIRQCLEIAGWPEAEYAEAANGREALQLLKQGTTDLLLTDLNMPTMDGRELVRRVTASPKLIGMPVVVITSSGNEARKQELIRLGANAVLRKPINPMKIAECLEGILGVEEET
ncbi:MAG: response regulator [bacterium]